MIFAVMFRSLACRTAGLALAALLLPVTALAQVEWKEADRLAEALNTAIDARTGLDGDPAEPTQLAQGTSILAGAFDDEESKVFDFYLDEGQSVVFSAGADEATEEVAIAVANDDGEILAEDEVEGNGASVRFTADEAGSYKVQVTLLGVEDKGYGALLALAPSESVLDGGSIGNAFIRAATTSLVFASEGGVTLSVAHEEGAWAVFGGYMQPNDQMGVSEYPLAEGATAVFGAGSEPGVDVNLFVETDNATAASDIEPDATPICTGIWPAGKYTLALLNSGQMGTIGVFLVAKVGG